eukprot:bmy_21829T0
MGPVELPAWLQPSFPKNESLSFNILTVKITFFSCSIPTWLTERIIILFVVITSQEEVQEKYVVCVLFIFWNLLDMVRYTYSMLSVIGISYAVLTWLSQTLWMPIYPLCVLAEAFAIYQSLPYFESFGTYSTKLPFDLSIYFPYVLKIYLMMLFIGMYFTYSHLYSERRDILRVFPIKKKKM